MNALRFHWRLPQGGERDGASRGYQASLAVTGDADLPARTAFCRIAEEAGIDGLLVDFGWGKPDPLILSAPLGAATTRLQFIAAHRSGLMSPTMFVQQVNTLSNLIDGRVLINVVAGHSPEEQRFYGDYLPHDERYARTEEFLAVCRALWRNDGPVTFEGKHYKVEGAKLHTRFTAPERDFPELFIAGNSPTAHDVALSQGTCWMQIADTPAKMAARSGKVLAAGKELGVRMSIIGGRTRGEALETAYKLVAAERAAYDDKAGERNFTQKSDSVSIRTTFALGEQSEWLTPWLWTGAVRTHGAPAIAIVGSPSEVAGAIQEYADAGVSQFIFSGWPKRESMLWFAEQVLPEVRAAAVP